MDAPPPPPWLDELPLRPGPPWHVMGTRAEAAPAWSHDPELLAEKRRLLDEVPDVVAVAAPGSTEAAAEAAAFVLGHEGTLEDAALAVAEDLCVLTRDGDGSNGPWRLAAAVVCFPSRWRPADKLGLPVAAIHDPVPAYADELGARVDRFLDALRPGRGAWRRNWFVHDDPTLHQPEPAEPATGPPVEVPEGLCLRSERQGLHALPRTGAVLFTIRTEQVPLAAVTGRPDVRRAMAAAMRAWSPALVAYRGAAPFHERVIAWLDAVPGYGP